MTTAMTAQQIGELHDDARQCAELARLRYVVADEPGLRRRRSGSGWRYSDATGHPLTDEQVKQRLTALAIPPAWKRVWICSDPDGHILATGVDERGRKQYIYHPRWRAIRDVLNFYRLLAFAGKLPTIRAHVDAQLRRRTLDHGQVVAVMIAIIDASYIRIGNDVYAEENESFGLSTLTRKHVHINAHDMTLEFPGKSGKQWQVVVDDARILRVVRKLLDVKARPGARLFVLDGAAITAEEVNAALHAVTGEHITAKDFRTWGGTLAAFEYLCDRLTSERKAQRIVNEALDEAADALGNTRSVARKHYVHPHVLETFTERTFGDYLDMAKPVPDRYLEPAEQQLAAFLHVLLTTEFALLREHSP